MRVGGAKSYKFGPNTGPLWRSETQRAMVVRACMKFFEIFNFRNHIEKSHFVSDIHMHPFFLSPQMKIICYHS